MKGTIGTARRRSRLTTPRGESSGARPPATAAGCRSTRTVKPLGSRSSSILRTQPRAITMSRRRSTRSECWASPRCDRPRSRSGLYAARARALQPLAFGFEVFRFANWSIARVAAGQSRGRACFGLGTADGGFRRSWAACGLLFPRCWLLMAWASVRGKSARGLLWLRGCGCRRCRAGCRRVAFVFWGLPTMAHRR
jgi:hypothetical protein